MDLNAMDIDNQVDSTMMGKEAVPAKDKTSINDHEHVTSPDDQRTTPGDSTTHAYRVLGFQEGRTHYRGMFFFLHFLHV
jgi:hypothetical protein